jgi:hypothetical protein
MSSVRMCDRCGTVFSENDEGWSTDSRTVNRIKEDGKRYQVGMQVDQCATCVGNPGQVTPRIPAQATAITPGTSLVDKTALEREIEQAEAADREATMALLRLQVEDLRDQLAKQGITPEVVIPTRLDTPGTATTSPPPIVYHGAGCPGHTTGLPAASCFTEDAS